MNVEKDTFILSTVWDLKRKVNCQFKECPRYGWMEFMMGYKSEGKPLMALQLCPTHYAEIMESWVQEYLPGILETFIEVDRKEYGLE